MDFANKCAISCTIFMPLTQNRPRTRDSEPGVVSEGYDTTSVLMFSHFMISFQIPIIITQISDFFTI